MVKENGFTRSLPNHNNPHHHYYNPHQHDRTILKSIGKEGDRDV